MENKYQIEFKDQYLTDEWNEVRKRILERDKYTCKLCGEKDSKLQVHHKYYLKDIKAWQYSDDCYETLCYLCHSNISTDKYKIHIGDVVWDYMKGKLKYKEDK